MNQQTLFIERFFEEKNRDLWKKILQKVEENIKDIRIKQFLKVGLYIDRNDRRK